MLVTNFLLDLIEENISDIRNLVLMSINLLKNENNLTSIILKFFNFLCLISAFILFFMGSGPVKGFSITLGVGILTTLFSVYFLARQLTSFL